MHLILATALTFPAAAPEDAFDAASTHRSEAVLAELHEINGPYTGDQLGSVARWRDLVAEHFAPSEVERAMQILECESHGDPRAKNPRSSAAGLFQFLQRTWDGAARHLDLPSYAEGGPYDPAANVEAAAWLVEEGSGWRHWTCAPRSWR
jgi:hypothetical protein